MIKIIQRTINSLLSKDLIKISILSLILTAVALGAFVGGAALTTSNTELVSHGWIDKALDWLFNAGAIVIAWFLFPILTPIIASFFVDQVASKIEENNYNGRLNKVPTKISALILEAVKFTFVMLLLNILCLPLYFVPVVNVFVYYLLNSYLISREFFGMASGCYVNSKVSKKLRKKNRLVMMGLGLIIVLISNIPILNLFAPILSVTLMVHAFFILNEKSIPGK